MYNGSSPHTRGAQESQHYQRGADRIIPAYAGSTYPPRRAGRTAADHPRIRGEHLRAPPMLPLKRGSSPHTRGARVECSGDSPVVGIIPAYAGSTAGLRGISSGMSDHPRIRGEHGVGRTGRSIECGSSPHTRGALLYLVGGAEDGRIIPAYAGSTGWDRRIPHTCRDHPRIRGEHMGYTRARPRPRWIIPAYAGSTGAVGLLSIRYPDHPRIRGEHPIRGLLLPRDRGSSPHTRGAPTHRRPWRSFLRIIPAYAGSTSGARCAARAPSDHPRIRGEHRDAAIPSRSSAGSSPHTRGAPSMTKQALNYYKDHPRIRGEHTPPPGQSGTHEGSSPHTRGARKPWIVMLAEVRIIPAYAGSTEKITEAADRCTDHPRIRGEHSWTTPIATVFSGSSPHTRGAPGTSYCSFPSSWIIPAYAGSTSSYPTCELPRTDHPRIRGEHAPWRLDVHVRERIIPAYAGSTPTRRRPSGCRRDHPRIRGEHAGLRETAPRHAGSSPHTRGAPARHSVAASDARIIPAYAGSTSRRCCDSCHIPDHPRIRGEHGGVSQATVSAAGSSPHTRGAHAGLRRRRNSCRIIPAYAGSTHRLNSRRTTTGDHPRIRGEHE